MGMDPKGPNPSEGSCPTETEILYLGCPRMAIFGLGLGGGCHGDRPGFGGATAGLGCNAAWIGMGIGFWVLGWQGRGFNDPAIPVAVRV